MQEPLCYKAGLSFDIPAEGLVAQTGLLSLSGNWDAKIKGRGPSPLVSARSSRGMFLSYRRFAASLECFMIVRVRDKTSDIPANHLFTHGALDGLDHLAVFAGRQSKGFACPGGPSSAYMLRPCQGHHS